MDKLLPYRDLGIREYQSTWQSMKEFTKSRGNTEDDQLWLLEHFPVFTQGLAGKPEHVLNAGDIPIVRTDRGGQVTFHGPGQAIIYLLLDIKSADVGVRPIVSMIENSTIDTLAQYSITSHARADAPGVYTEEGKKIASLGLKVSRGFTYHGVSIDVDMDLEPFSRINPCGLTGMKMAQVNDFAPGVSVQEIQSTFMQIFSKYWYAASAIKNI